MVPLTKFFGKALKLLSWKESIERNRDEIFLEAILIVHTVDKWLSPKEFRDDEFPKIFSCGNIFLWSLVKQSRSRSLAGKEVINMKSISLLISALFLTGALGLSIASAGAENVISQDVLTAGSYCHTKFESIREDTLSSSQPVLKDTDDIIDFYGPCNHDPLGKEEIQSQKIEMQHRFQSEYND
jgi:hypothetical protein